MKENELFEGFDEGKIDEYKAEARRRWGQADAFKQSEKRTKDWSKADFDRVKLEWDEIARDHGSNMLKGVKSDEIQTEVERHFNQINKFYDCDHKMFLCLADMYVEDPRFAANYEKYDEDLPEFVREAILYYCNK